jgi:hypothetical protein
MVELRCQNFEIAVGLLVLGAKDIRERRFSLKLLSNRAQFYRSVKEAVCDLFALRIRSSAEYYRL